MTTWHLPLVRFAMCFVSGNYRIGFLYVSSYVLTITTHNNISIDIEYRFLSHLLILGVLICQGLIIFAATI